MSGFDPGRFLNTVQALLPVARCEADHRTIAGRAYYAVYGILRTRLCAAKGEPPTRMFGRVGRHGDVANAMSVAGAEFKRLASAYKLLHSMRVVSDYKYEEPVTRAEAQCALDDARWIVARLRRMDDGSFRTFPLRPLRTRSS